MGLREWSEIKNWSIQGQWLICKAFDFSDEFSLYYEKTNIQVYILYVIKPSSPPIKRPGMALLCCGEYYKEKSNSNSTEKYGQSHWKEQLECLHSRARDEKESQYLYITHQTDHKWGRFLRLSDSNIS